MVNRWFMMVNNRWKIMEIMVYQPMIVQYSTLFTIDGEINGNMMDNDDG